MCFWRGRQKDNDHETQFERGATVWEREVESPTLTTASCFSSTTCTREPRCTLFTLKSLVLNMMPQCWSSFNYLAYLHKILQFQWHRRGAHCWHQHQGDNALQSLKFAPVRTSYRTVWDLIIVCTHDEKLLSPHAGRSQRLRRLKVAPKLDFLRHFLCHVACSKLQT